MIVHQSFLGDVIGIIDTTRYYKIIKDFILG